MEKLSEFPFNVENFLVGTINFSAEEVGSYILMLCRQWDKGYVLDEELEKIARVKIENLSQVLKKFKHRKNRFFNERLLKVKQTAIGTSEKNSKNGKKGAQKRWRGGSHNINEVNELDSEAINSPLAKDGTAINSPLASRTGARAAAITNSNIANTNTIKEKQLKEKIFEQMRLSVAKNFSDELLKRETDLFFGKYGQGKIKNLASLVNSWLEKVEPDIKPKTMVL